jgi:hypothetical protein
MPSTLSLRREFLERQERWLGGNDLSFAPILFDYVIKKSKKENGLISAIIEVRNSQAAKEYRAGVAELAESLSKSKSQEVNTILSDLEKMAHAWQQGFRNDRGSLSRRIRLEIPFIRGLGSKIASLVPKRAASPSERIFTFLHAIPR